MYTIVDICRTLHNVCDSSFTVICVFLIFLFAASILQENVVKLSEIYLNSRLQSNDFHLTTLRYLLQFRCLKDANLKHCVVNISTILVKHICHFCRIRRLEKVMFTLCLFTGGGGGRPKQWGSTQGPPVQTYLTMLPFSDGPTIQRGSIRPPPRADHHTVGIHTVIPLNCIMGSDQLSVGNTAGGTPLVVMQDDYLVWSYMFEIRQTLYLLQFEFGIQVKCVYTILANQLPKPSRGYFSV